MKKENSIFKGHRIYHVHSARKHKKMVKTACELREEILRLNPLTSLYWDKNMENWIFIVAKSKNLNLHSYGYETENHGDLPEAEEFLGMKKLVLNGMLIGYVISGKNL